MQVLAKNEIIKVLFSDGTLAILGSGTKLSFVKHVSP
jgi:hypothetical protein